MLRAVTFFVLFFMSGFSASLFAQETQSTQGAVLILGAASREQTFQIEVKTESGVVFTCPQVVSARNICRLEGVPPGKVTVIGKIGGKQMKALALNVPAVGAEVGIEREGYGIVITLGVLTAIGAAALVVEIIENNVNGIIESSILLGGAGTFLVIGLLKGRDSLVANGKTVKKDGSIRASLSPVFLPQEQEPKKPTVGLGITVSF